MDTLTALQNCTIHGTVVKLPDTQLDRKVYLDVKNKLELIGGKWKGGKVFGFQFQDDPTELLADIAGGENRNLKKEYQYFATPEDLAERMVLLADIQPVHSILEPSAGQGAIVKQINRVFPVSRVHCFELMETNRKILTKNPNVILAGEDFLQADPELEFDRIVANPPFSKNQDIDHIYKMWSLLKENGVMVSLASKHWQISNNKKETAFRNWISQKQAFVEQLPAGTFKESGTEIETCLIQIYK